MLALIRKGITHGNYAGHPTHVKSLTLELPFNSTSTTGSAGVYLNVDYNSYQLKNKIVTGIICNTLFVPTPSVFNGNIRSGIKKDFTGSVTTVNDLRNYGFTITLVNNQNNYLVFYYPLMGLLSTSQERVPSSNITGRSPRTYKFFNLEIDPDKSFIDTYDPTLTVLSNKIISLEFFYIDKK